MPQAVTAVDALGKSSYDFKKCNALPSSLFSANKFKTFS